MKKWILLTIVTISAFASVFIPAWFIQPFKAQTSEIVKYSFLLRRWSPELTLFLSALAIVLLVSMWKRMARWWKKAGATMLVAVCIFTAWFSRQNYYEWMFNALQNVAYASASKANHVNDSDMVLAVLNNGDAAAYPVRLLAYHHIVHDVVGGKPIVATY